MFDKAHKAELLMKYKMPLWAKEALDTTKSFANNIACHPSIGIVLAKLVKYNDEYHENKLKQLSTTRFTEYGHHHIDSVLRNLKLYIDGFPSIIQSEIIDNNLKEDLKGWLYTISSTSLIIQLLLIDKIFDFSFLEIKVQSEEFNVFEFENYS